MDLTPVASVAAIVAALAIAPVLGSGLVDLERTQQADVVADDDAYGSVETYTATLCLLLDDSETVIDVTHNYTSSATLFVEVTTPSDLFAIAGSTATLAQGETASFEVEGTSLLGSTGLFTIDLHVDIRPRDGADRGVWTMTREAQVEVLLC